MEFVEKTFTYRGTTTTLHFRELTAGEQLRLSQGVRSTVREGVSEVTLDFAAEAERGHRLLQATLIDPATEKPVYSSIAKLHDEPSTKVKILVDLARTAQAEFAQKASEAGEG